MKDTKLYPILEKPNYAVTNKQILIEQLEIDTNRHKKLNKENKGNNSMKTVKL